MTSDSKVQNLQFVSFKEDKVPSRNAGERFYLKFYLETADGTQILAATAEDQGDAHYSYKNARGFNQYGLLDSHSRKDVIKWLEKIIHESSSRSQKTTPSQERMLLKTPDHPEGVYFVGEDQHYTNFPDGRRCTQWYLIDNHGISHQAVVGEENHARDGHYIYRSVEPFSSVKALECRNKAGVYHWLELWIVHEDGLSRSKQRDRQRRTRPKPRPVVLDVGSTGGALKKPKNDHVSFRSPIRPKLPVIHPEVMKAQHQVKEKEKLMLDAINFCFGSVTENEIEALQHWMKILDEMKAQWDRGIIYDEQTYEAYKDERLENESLGFTYLKRNFYGLCLEAFREIGTMFISLELMKKSNIAKIMACFKNYPTSDIGNYAQCICARWDQEIRKHKEVMLSGEMLVDPMEAVAHLLPKATLVPIESLIRNDEKEMDID
eukprot:g166.t1